MTATGQSVALRDRWGGSAATMGIPGVTYLGERKWPQGGIESCIDISPTMAASAQAVRVPPTGTTKQSVI